MDVAPDISIQLSTIGPNFEPLFTLVDYEAGLNVYLNSNSLLFSDFYASGKGRLLKLHVCNHF
jgi:hypothetical protein